METETRLRAGERASFGNDGSGSGNRVNVKQERRAWEIGCECEPQCRRVRQARVRRARTRLLYCINALLMHSCTRRPHDGGGARTPGAQQREQRSKSERAKARSKSASMRGSEGVRDEKRERRLREREHAEKSSHSPPLVRVLEIDCGLREDREPTADC